jgi:hypothetical protein
VPAHIPVALRRVPPPVKTGVVLVAFVVTAVSLSLGFAGWHSRAHIRPELLVTAEGLTPPIGFTAVRRPEIGDIPHAIDPAPPETWQYWAPTSGRTDPCPALLAAFTPQPGWQVDHAGSICAVIRRSGRLAIVISAWSASALRLSSDLPGAPSQPGITAEVAPNDGYLP